MLIAFYLLAALMIIIALAVVLLPMVRRGRQHGRPRGIFVLALALALILPLSAIGIYALVGTPAAVQASVRDGSSQPKITVDQAIAQLQQHVAKKPGDLQAWLLLGRFYSTTKQPADARDAYAHAIKLQPNDADIMVAWVEADSLARPDHLIAGASRTRLQDALKIAPNNERGLWLMGISNYQAGHFVDATLTWRRLLVLLKPDSDVADAVTRQIAMANARAAGKTQKQAQALLQRGQPKVPVPAASASASVPASAAQVSVKVSLAPTLQDKVDGNDTLFVYAHAATGSPVPLAIQRMKVSQLPTTITLTDAKAMTTKHNLSSVKQVSLTARISRNGQAKPQPGDLQGQTGPVPVAGHNTAKIVIDHTL